MFRIIAASLLITLSFPIFAVGAPAPMSRVEFDALMQEISNWGRWGDDDELGTLNLITEAKRQQAAGLVTEGISVT